MADWVKYASKAMEKGRANSMAPANAGALRLPAYPNVNNNAQHNNVTPTGAATSVWAGAVKTGQNKNGDGSQNDKKGLKTYTINAGNQPYVNQLNDLYNQIMGRQPFQYDVNGDLLYRQMADRYEQMGQMAMRDATGTAAGLTGGYGNSYANQVGNQAYQQYMTALNDNIPSLYDRALQAYLAETEQMMQKYQLTAAHPGAVEAIKPQTYTVSTKEEGGIDAITYAALLGAMLGGPSNASPAESAGADTTVTPETTYNPSVNPLSYGNIYYNRLLKK